VQPRFLLSAIILMLNAHAFFFKLYVPLRPCTIVINILLMLFRKASMLIFAKILAEEKTA